MKLLIPILIILTCNEILAGDIKFPGNNFAEGWNQSGDLAAYHKNDLYGHINGGAELFLEFGFDSLVVQNYVNSHKEISFEIYVMETPESALGIYLMKCGKESPSQNLNIRNTSNPYQIIAVNNKYYVQVNNFSGEKEAFAAMELLINRFFEDQPVLIGDAIFKQLPSENLIAESIKLIRGQYALQPIYTFGEGDIFQLKGEIFAVTGRYMGEDGHIFRRIIIDYPDEIKANAAFNNLITHLDPYLSVIESTNSTLVFQDYQNKYGKVTISGDELRAVTNLNKAPE